MVRREFELESEVDFASYSTDTSDRLMDLKSCVLLSMTMLQRTITDTKHKP